MTEFLIKIHFNQETNRATTKMEVSIANETMMTVTIEVHHADEALEVDTAVEDVVAEAAIVDADVEAHAEGHVDGKT